MMRLELMTSSLPRMCATTCATSASTKIYVLSYRRLEAPPRIELGIKVLQTSALPLGYGAIGADYGVRTRYLHLGKVALYQMS